MKITTVAARSIPRALALVTSALLWGTLAGGCVVDPEIGSEEETSAEAQQALTAYGFTWTSSTDDWDGITVLQNNTQRTCVLSGIAGNLTEGEYTTGSQSLKSEAGVSVSGSYYTLFAHGGATTDVHNARQALNNLVLARTTCFPVGTTTGAGFWESGNPVKIADLGTSQRQCFLTKLITVTTDFNSSTHYARVVPKSTTDATHPTTGWYIESNLPQADNDKPRVYAECLDFSSATFVSSSLSSTSGVTTTQNVATSLGTTVPYACALTGVQGAFNVDDDTNGILLTSPSGGSAGTWSMTVKGAKTGSYTCAQ